MTKFIIEGDVIFVFKVLRLMADNERQAQLPNALIKIPNSRASRLLCRYQGTQTLAYIHLTSSQLKVELAWCNHSVLSPALRHIQPSFNDGIFATPN